MKIQFDIGHPAHVHLWKNSIKYFQKKGHETLITCRNKEVALRLLDAERIEHIPLGEIGSNKLQLAGEWFARDLKIIKLAKKFDPDIFLGVLNPCIAHASALLNKPCIIFNDSEVVKFTKLITYPFVDAIITPEKYGMDEGRKHIRVNSYKELAYLHPNNFQPSDRIFDYLDISKREKYIILRIVSWGAGHDILKKGFTNEFIFDLIADLEKSVKVIISSERPLPASLNQYLVKFPPEMMHDALYHAKALICDSQTMATEAGILGTPAVRCNDFIGKKDMSNFIELEHKYKLIFNYSEKQNAKDKILELVNQNNIKKEWMSKRRQLINDKIDLSHFFQQFIENYPDSLLITSYNNKQNG